MLAAAQANIPPELRQYLEVVPGSERQLALPSFGKLNDGKPTVKFLSFSSGVATEYQAVFGGNVLVIKRIHQQTTVYDFSLPEGVEIVDVEYLQTLDGLFGLAVLYNDGDDAYLARFVHGGEKLKPVHETIIPYPGFCLKVVLDDIEIARASASLNTKMHSWTNVVVVGTEFGHAYVLYLPNNPYWNHESPPETRKLTDALSSYHHDNKFVYRVEGRANVVKDISEVCVTSIAYIPRSCDLLIGLSFGGIVQVGFTPSGDLATNVFQCSSPVCHIVPLLPHDDPNMNVWFCAFHGERGKTLVMVLYEGSYRVIGQENVATRDRDFKRAMFWPRMANQVAGKGTAAEWISAHPLARDRKVDETNEQNLTLNDTDLDLSQMFFSYIDGHGILKFGIFDLNTYYYKRLHPNPTPDNTPARQCPYLIDVTFEPPNSCKMLDNITDIMVDCSYISRFQFMSEDPEQQIYASGLNLSRIYIGSSSATATFQLRSLPSQVLGRIYENLNAYSTNWRLAGRSLLAVGLMSSPLDVNGGSAAATSALLYGHTSYEMVMTAAILYGHTDSVVQLINSTKEVEWSAVRVKCEWMWSEVQRARDKLDMLNDILFSDTAKHLSLEQKRQFRQLNAVLRSAKHIYRAVQEKYAQWQKSVPRILVLESESQLAAVNNVSDFANCIRNLYTMKYLPLGERNLEERQVLEDLVHERRSKLRALSVPKNLVVDEIVAKMQQIEPNEPFWLDQEGEEWYPPAVHNAVTPLLKPTYHNRMKQEFIIYYIIDLVVAKKTLQIAGGKPETRNIIFHVKEILDEVLNIGEKEINAVFDKWHREQQLIIEETHVEDKVVAEGLEEKINSLIKKAEQLTIDQENGLKEMCNKIPYGQFRYQLYLIERSRFNDVEILTVPTSVHNPYVELYVKALPVIRRVKQFLEPMKRVNNAPSWPSEVRRKFKEFVPSEKPAVSQVKKDTAGLSVPLFKRIQKHPKAVEPEEMDVCQEQDIITTPEKNDRMETEDDVTPQMNELDEKTKEKINCILRTPTSRRSRAAAAAEGQTGIQITPETQCFIPAPTSILKTPIRQNRSPSRGRIRWDPEFVEPSIDNTTLSSTTESLKNLPVMGVETPILKLSMDTTLLSSDTESPKPVPEFDSPITQPSFDNTTLSSSTESPEKTPVLCGETPILEPSIDKTTLSPNTDSPKNTSELVDDKPEKPARSSRRIRTRTSETQEDPIDVGVIESSSKEAQPEPKKEEKPARTALAAVFGEPIEEPKSTRRSARKSRSRTVSETQEVPAKIRATPTRSRSRAVSEPREVELRTTPTRSSSKKTKSARVLEAVVEETAAETKSPTRSVRKFNTISETVAPVRVRTTPTRSCTKAAVGAYAESSQRKSPARRALAAVFEEAAVEPKSPTRSSSRRAKTPSNSQEVPAEAKSTRSGRKVVASQSDTMHVKSPTRRARTAVSEETVAAPKSPSRKSTRASKTTGPSLVEQFRANLAKRTAANKKPPSS